MIFEAYHAEVVEHMEQARLFNPILIETRQVALKDIVPWDTGGARSQTKRSHEARFLKRMMASGFEAGDIAQLLGIKPQIIQKRLKLLTLHPRLLEGVEQGLLAVSVAEAAANLRPDQQEELLGELDSRGKIRLADVRETRKVDRTAALVNLFADDEAYRPDLKGNLVSMLKAAREQGLSKKEVSELVKEVYR